MRAGTTASNEAVPPAADGKTGASKPSGDHLRIRDTVGAVEHPGTTDGDNTPPDLAHVRLSIS
jgi:hypothetical protein